MDMEHEAKPKSPEEMRLVHHALENSTRRKMLILMTEGCLKVSEIIKAVGPAMLDYHLHRLELAGLIEVTDGIIAVTDSGRSYGALIKAQAKRGGADLM